jgi:hypothetical protein
MMSAENNESEAAAAADEVCASCGKAEVDDVKLKKCDGGCDLAKYCSDGCQELHRPEHEEACKNRVREIRDDRLFTQPDESHLGECPICCLPNPLHEQKSQVCPSCCKRICHGCNYANQKREVAQGHRGRSKCLFCREPLPSSMKVGKKKLMKRVKANDTYAMVEIGSMFFYNGD